MIAFEIFLLAFLKDVRGIFFLEKVRCFIILNGNR